MCYVIMGKGALDCVVDIWVFGLKMGGFGFSLGVFFEW